MRRIRLQDPMKAKKLKEALHQMAEEGVVQIFLPHDGSPAIIGVVGALQLDVLKERMQAEYGLPVDFEPSRFTVARWITSPDKIALDQFVERHRSSMAADLDGAPVFMAPSGFELRYELDRADAITASEIKDYQREEAA
jgi:peptide chain release factor 3